MPIVSTSYWPPLVAMSTVTFSRSTFSSSVTHLTSIPGLALVNSLVSPCMRIMSPLFTVAIVRVSAWALPAATKHAAPMIAERMGFICPPNPRVLDLALEPMLTL